MKALFGAITIFVCIFSFMSAAGFAKFETLRVQAIGKDSFELFTVLLIILIGVRGLFASRATPDLFRISGSLITAVQGIYISTSGAFIGWICGFIFFSIFSLNANNIILGILLLIYVVLLTGPLLLWRQEIEKQALEYIDFRIRERKFAIVFRSLCIAFIVIGLWGLSQIL